MNDMNVYEDELSDSTSKPSKKRRIIWTTRHENLLLRFWRENLSQLRNTKRNGHIIQKITFQMCKHEADVSPDEVKAKIRNLSARYRSEKCKQLREGIPSDWPRYEIMHDLLGGSDNQNDEVTMESGSIEDNSTEFPSSFASASASTSNLRLKRSNSFSSDSSCDKTEDPVKAKKGKSFNFQKEILKSMEKLQSEAEETTVEIRKANEEFSQHTLKMMDLFKSYSDDVKEMKKELIDYLRRH